ncbi:MAG: type II toxin-antitoxin system RelE/ParE family toxin [Candidatus Diapherotrites archaeon]
MAYSLESEPSCKKAIKKACKKNKELEKALKNKISEILENPQRFKPLKYNLAGQHRVHILKSFVLTYEINENLKTVKMLIFDHHDNIYEK